MSNWGDHETSVKGGHAHTPKTADYGPGWLSMTPVKRYEHHTLYAKKTRRGDIYFECFLNTELDQYRKGHSNA